MKVVAYVAVMLAISAWIITSGITEYSEIKEACAMANGTLLSSRSGVICIRPEAIIDVRKKKE